MDIDYERVNARDVVKIFKGLSDDMSAEYKQDIMTLMIRSTCDIMQEATSLADDVEETKPEKAIKRITPTGSLEMFFSAEILGLKIFEEAGKELKTAGKVSDKFADEKDEKDQSRSDRKLQEEDQTEPDEKSSE